MSVLAARIGRQRSSTAASASNLLVGAAIGTGMAAKAAVRGGSDLLLALNAGRMRSMGAPSIASLLPLRDSNALVMDFGCSEILPASGGVPVFFGASAFDPRQSLPDLVDRIAAAGFHGIVNFPTSIFFAERFRRQLDATGCGFERERQLLQLAQRRGLMTLAFVHTPQDIDAMASAGVDIINLNLGWNHGGQVGVRSGMDLAEASEYARQAFRRVRRVHPAALCMVEGGPIVRPADMYHVCHFARADGYIGGSTIDRVPQETSVADVTAAFKAVSTIRKSIDELERQIEGAQARYGIIGCSTAIRQVQAQVGRIARHARPVLIVGPQGSGKELVARALCIANGRPPNSLVPLTCDGTAEQRLFGAGATALATSFGRRGLLQAAGQAVFIEDVSALPAGVQARLIAALENRQTQSSNKSSAWLLCALPRDPEALVREKRLDPRLALLFEGRRIVLPPLTERMEDLPLLANYLLRQLRGSARSRAMELDHSAYRVLMSYHWPGNVRELRVVLEQAVRNCNEEIVTAEHLPPLREAQAPPRNRDERSWILDALQRHRFRRAETARYLGISRKTLYNKMRQLQLPTGEK